MITCPSCGAQCESGARFCLECGEPLEEAAAPADPWLGRMVAGRFRLLSKLGDGGMGEVYRAEQMPMGRHIALKILRQSLSDDPKQVERFKREAQAASALSHPNTIIVHDFGQDTDGTLFIAMELLEGEPLSEVLEREGALSPERAAGILRQICGSLDEAHAQGLVHRDLKPENVFLTERAGAQDFVKVLDFGIAKVTESGGQKLDTITQAGAIFGTPQYMAPEQIRGEGVDARADIYALGVILYEMISGHLPFAAGSVVEMLTKHLTAPPAPIVRDSAAKVDANVPRLEAIALRALSKDPTRRQQSARAFLEDLMAAMPQLSITATTGIIPATPAGTPALDSAPTSSGSAGKVVLIAAILAAVGVGGYFLLAQNGGGGGPLDMAPAALLQPVGDNGGGGGPASAPASKAAASQPASAAPESKAPDTKAPASVAAPTSAAPTTEAGPTEAEKAAAAAAEKAAEEQAKKDEAEAKKKEAEANKPLTDEEAKRIAAAAEAEAKQAEAEAKKAAAEKKAKAQAERAKKAEAAKAEAQAAKANAVAEKKAALQQASEAKAAAAAAKAQAKEAEAKAKAAAAKNEAEKQAAMEAQKKAAADLAKAQAAAEKVKAEAAKQAAEAARLKAEADALKAQLAKIEEEKAAAAAAEAEAKAKREEAKRKAAAARKKKRAKSAFAKVYIRTRSIGARISVDGKSRGVTPLRGGLRLRPGKHRVTVVNRKGKRKNQTINVKPGKVQRFKINI